MQTVHSIVELRAQLRDWRARGQRIAFVPTMGNLHRGHLELVRRGRGIADRVVSSVFVNPLQFGPSEDFNRYPRTLEQDKTALAAADCDLLFAPTAAEVYPRGMERLARVSVPDISNILCGHFRPGHFDGVATVVSILFNLVQPDIALFGEKDYQQLQVIRRLVRDLDIQVEIVGGPTARAEDGLALSSRNAYLTPQERQAAPEIARTLTAAVASLRAGRPIAEVEAEAVARLTAAGFARVDYVEVRGASDLARTGLALATRPMTERCTMRHSGAVSNRPPGAPGLAVVYAEPRTASF